MEALLVVLVALVGMATAVPPLMDLSHIYDYDSHASHDANVLKKRMDRIYIGVQLNQMCSSQPTGTHVEAPITFKNDSWTVQDIPLERLWRVPGVMFDVGYQENRDYQITAEILQDLEYRSGLTIPDGGILLIRTRFWPRGTLSMDDDGSDTPEPQPLLTEDAGRWLANYGSRHGYAKGIYGVGINLSSLDGKDENSTSSARARLYEKDIYALHNLKNMEYLPKSGFLLTVMPMKILDAAAAPVRVMAEKVVVTRTRPDESEEDDLDEDRVSDWNSESDSRYPHPGWGYGGGMEMSAAGDRGVTGSYSSMIIALPLLVALRG